MIGLLRKADTLRIFDDLLADEEFWREFSQELERALAPRLLVIFFAGAEAAARLPKRRAEKAQPAEASDYISPEALARIGEQAIQGYVSPFAKQITQTTYDGVRDAVVRARRDGTGVEGVIEAIKPMFSSKRAELIAVTETTRLFGLGSQAIYQAQGYTHWEWRTAEDPWVDDECAGLNGQVFPISRSFEPAHPRCRCWPTPAFAPQAAIPSVSEQPKPLGSAAQKRAFSAWWDELSEDQRAAITRYTGDYSYVVNDKLRRGEALDKTDRAWLKNAQAAMDRAPSTAQPMTVYRGLIFDPDRVSQYSLHMLPGVGDVLTDRGFMSTTGSQAVAKRFASEVGSNIRGVQRPYILEIEAPVGTRGAWLSGGPWPGKAENEYLLPPGTSLRITEVVSEPSVYGKTITPGVMRARIE